MVGLLPNEVLSLVLSFLQVNITYQDNVSMQFQQNRHHERAALCRIALVSRRFHALAQPVLYRTLLIDRYTQKPALVRALSKSPRLGRMVAELHFLQEHHLDTPGELLRPLFVAARPQLVGLTPETGDGILDGLASSTRRVFEDAATAFWLALVPDVKKLSLFAPRKPRLVSALFQDAVYSSTSESSPERPFGSLSEIRLQPTGLASENEFAANFNIGAFESVFELPSIRSLRTFHASWLRFDSVWDFLTPGVGCSLQSIRLESTSIGVLALRSLLASCENLRELRADIGIHPEPRLSCEDLGAALRARGRSLESLSLDFFHEADYIGGAEVEQLLLGRIGSLQPLTCLKHLSVPLHVLVGLDGTKTSVQQHQLHLSASSVEPMLELADLLPASLETLDLDRVLLEDKDYKETIWAVLQSERLSRLRSILLPYFEEFPTLPENILSLGWEEAYDYVLDKAKLRNRDRGERVYYNVSDAWVIGI